MGETKTRWYLRSEFWRLLALWFVYNNKWSILKYFIAGMMCKLKKNAVIFNVGNDIKDPIVVIQPQMFNKEEPDSCIPLLGIYNGTHYQSVFPASKKDEQLTVDIVKYFPDFQGNFKSFFKAKYGKLKNAPVLPTVQQIFEFEANNFGPNCRYDETASEQDNSETQATEEKNATQATYAGLNSRYEETASEQENSEIEATDGGLNSMYEETASEQENSKTDGGLNSMYEEIASEQENSEIEARLSSSNSMYEETASEQENSKTDGGLNSMYEETASEQENFKIQATDGGLNSRYEETASELENLEIEATDGGLNSRYEETVSKQENSETQATDDALNSSYEVNVQRTNSLYESTTQTMETQLNSKDRKVMWLYVSSAGWGKI
jgi:hypothetical protein